MKISFYALLFLVGSIVSCEDTGPAANLPKCIHTSLIAYQPACPDGVTVDEYYFQQQLVYVHNNNACCCDYSSPVLSTSCDTLGHLGGFAGNSTINGESFENAVFQRTVWP